MTIAALRRLLEDEPAAVPTPSDHRQKGEPMPQPAAPHPSASTTAPIHVGQLLAWAEAHDNKAVFRMGQQAVELLRELHGLYVTGEEAQRPETGLPAEQPCTDPRHTGAIRERLGCSGPDPATT